MESRPVLEPEAVQLLSEYGTPYPEHCLASSVDEAVRLADRLRYPVVLKVVSSDVVHKSRAGGVVVGAGDHEAVRAAYEQILDGVQRASPMAHIEGVLVCKQAPEGFEVIVGGLDDPAFGPTVMFRVGGVFAEVHEDVEFRIAPLERRDAEDMIHEIEAYPVLAGARGQSRYDLDTLVELLLTVARLLLEHPEIKELDLNPVRLYDRGLLVLDARVVVSDGN